MIMNLKKIHNNLLKKISLTKNTFKKINNVFNDKLYKNLNYKKINTKNIILKYKNINQINQKALLNKHNFNTNLSVYNILKNNNNQKYNYINKNINSLELITKLFYNKKLNIVQTSNIFIDIKNNLNYFDTDRLDDTFVTSDNYRVKNYKFPIKINKGILNKQNINTLQNNLSLIKNIFFNFKTYKLNISEKQSHVEQFWGFRQKRYKKLRSYSFLQNTKYNNDNYQQISNFVNNKFNKYYMYTVLKNNKYKNELIPVTLARRLLRTKRTLVLPVHINITLITNSYDVVHSWFVPGLGLKIDCVPGRSTHHSLYIDNVGFYYGQCAEICGRYHHHMPIRVCAIPYEHFIVWWQVKGLPRIYRSTKMLNTKKLLQKN